ncbi:DUF2145 domain-containing protein [Rugamonas apoptosis]|uniref:DUF2145 domain-containing protein n=1 Tax=Rugamonas apoptosis TaxID=2758570 RepID=A0A7W2FBE0_9BURK|nr:DUF2145 domain-containing protein [Rugamonas apoptosis]MBA5688627.1 DUF2145 domain-containing protein [Rugamonas apoptosis]
MSLRRALTRLAACAALACACAGAAQAAGLSGASRFCDSPHELNATEQDHLLRFAAVVREELDASAGSVALVSRSGLDLSRFGIRYSHAALAWRAQPADSVEELNAGAWSARQLYYACDESRPRIYDQGLAGFAMGTDDPALGYISLLRLPAAASPPLQAALLDNPRALHLLAQRYSANAYAYGLAYQNCNQWLVEMLAVAWAGMADGDDLRARAQDWLRAQGYAPEPVDVGSRLLMLAPYFIPLLNLDDHPAPDRDAMRLQVSLPAGIETFMRRRLPGSERVEICHDDKQVVVHRGWSPVADGCVPGPDDRVVPFD